jgi:adenylate cyclase
MLSPVNRRNLIRLVPFGLIWLLFGWIFLVVEIAAAGSVEGLPATAIEMDLKVFVFSSLALLAVGLFIGFIELAYLDNAFARKSFAQKILFKLLIYSFIFFLIILLTYPLAAALELGSGMLDDEVWAKFSQYLGSLTFLSTALQLGVSLLVSLFYTEIGDNIGHGILLNFFTGKYHKPVEEERIFMFLDMKSSTTIAEQLGHTVYFRLLRAYYADLSDAIIRHDGEIYQYVGDEVIVSWPFQQGLDNGQCLRCFFAMKKDLAKKADWFKKHFGLVPSFKAGIHYGKVTTGEIGVIKKEIFFTGDVLNATARIQALCNDYKVDLLISGELMRHIKTGPAYREEAMGYTELRGRKEKMELYTMREGGGE